MRKIAIFLTVTFLLSIGSISLACDQVVQKIEPNKLTLTGKVKTIVKADRASLSFEIKGEGKSLKKAFADAQGRMDKIASKLYDIGLTDKNISTSFFKNAENRDGSRWTKKDNYKTVITASINTDKLNLLKDIIIILSENEVEYISDISFDIIDIEQVKLDALTKATAKIKQKADLMASQLGAKYGNLLKLGESTNRIYPQVTGFQSPFNAVIDLEGLKDGSLAGIFPEEIQFETQVTAVYELLPSGQ